MDYLQDQHIDELIAKYLSNNTTPSEVETLENWVLADDQNKQHFLKMKKAWMLSGIEQNTGTANTDKAWQELNQKIVPPMKIVPSKSTKRRWLAIAASMALLLVASFWFYQFLQPNDLLQVATTTATKRLQLEDGTDVVLNQESSLQFAINEKAGKRMAYLEGDAYFEVHRDTKQPFIVKTKHAVIEVLGTSFYIDTREAQQEVQIIVEEGKVAVKANNGSVVLEQGEKAIFSKITNQLVKIKNQDPNYNALKTNILQFDNTPLAEVAFALNRQYNTQINLKNESLKNCQLNATFKQKSLESVLKIIESTLEVDITRIDNKVVISGSCN